MDTSVRWINDYLDPPASAEEQADLATRAGFPLEGTETVEVSDGTDTRQDFEMTSNRGDCVCHLGLAREIAAISGRALKIPRAEPATGPVDASSLVSVTNHEPDLCPLYTARVIRGVTVGPSPDWLADRIRARGDIPRNNVVDATNFVLFELGQPTHVFDLARLEGPAIHVRKARPDEPFLPIGEGEHEITLVPDDLVIADASAAVALAGVKGGALSAVTGATTDIVLEAATFDPVSVRTTSRRHVIGSDSSYRFERGVHPAQVNPAADRLAALILELAGGELCRGVVSDGAPIPEPRRVSMRVDRCRRILGVPITDEEMATALDRLGFAPQRNGDRLACVAPCFRLDIEREIDLIEEVGRMYGHDRIPVRESIELRVVPPQPTELARQAVFNELVGMGFVETVTHSLIPPEAAETFMPSGATALRVEGEGQGKDSVLQPSVVPGLLAVRRHNLDHGVGTLRLFESAATFRSTASGPDEDVRLALVMDIEDEHAGLRPLRGVVERLVKVLRGPDAVTTVSPDDGTSWLDPGVTAHVEDTPIGRIGRLASGVAERFGLDEPLLVAELRLAPFYESFPPETPARALPTFPSIERDLSPVVAEDVPWANIEACIERLDLPFHERVEFITTFRSDAIGAGRKSVTFRLRFRAPDRTLTHDEVDAQVDAVITALRTSVGAVLRSGHDST